MKAYLYILKMQIILGLTYRFEVFAVIATKVVILVASIFLWYNIYSGMNVIDGVTLTQMTTYVIISGFVITSYSIHYTKLYEIDLQCIILLKLKV